MSINDNTIDYLDEIPQNTYHKYCKNVYSQNGEDGILEQIFKELNIEKGILCEFGASDGITSSNSINLLKKGWTGVLIEGDSISFNKLKQNINIPGVHLVNKFIANSSDEENSLNTILKSHNIPYDFDMVSIDIDCNDYYVWSNFNDFRPKIVIIEVNSYRDPVCIEYPHKKAYDNNDILEKWYPARVKIGTSFLAIIKLGLEKGYVPLSFTGNIIFIDKKYVPLLKEFPYKISDDPFYYIDLYTNLSMWNNNWYTCTGLTLNTAIRNYYLKYKSTDIDFDWVYNNMLTLNEKTWNFTI